MWYNSRDRSKAETEKEIGREGGWMGRWRQAPSGANMCIMKGRQLERKGRKVCTVHSFIHSFKGCCIIHYNHMNNTELLFSLRLHSGAGKQLVFKSEKKKM